MRSLKDLRQKRQSISSIQKVIEAMRMISKAKFNHVNRQNIEFRTYYRKFIKIMNDLLNNTIDQQPAPTNNKQLLVVVSSDRGMCGSFNMLIVNRVKRFILDHKSGDIYLLCVGSKGFSQLENIGNILHRTLAFERVKFIDAQSISHDMESLLRENDIQRCSIAYTKMHSILRQEVVIESMLPLKIEGRQAEKPDEASQALKPITLFEPNHGLIMRNLKSRYFITKIYNALIESTASEQAARMNAMESASKNANDIHHELSLDYNRTRQALITKEISEIVSNI